MVRLERLTEDELRAALDEVDEKTPVLRLVVALNYKHGLTQTAIAEQYGLARKTIYNWLKRFETRPLEDAIYDDDRSGRPPKLTSEQRRSFEALLQRPPNVVGYDETTWTPALAQRLVDDVFGVEYSIPHLRRLLRDAGLTPTDSGWQAVD